MTPEGKTKQAIKKVLKKHPGTYPFWPVQSGYGAKTIDCLVCVYGYFVGVEAKAPGKEPTDLQWVTIGEIQRAGGIVLVIDTVEGAQKLEELIERLKHASARQPEAQNAGRPVRPRRGKPVRTTHKTSEYERGTKLYSSSSWSERDVSSS